MSSNETTITCKCAVPSAVTLVAYCITPIAWDILCLMFVLALCDRMLVRALCLLVIATSGQAADPCIVAQLLGDPRRSSNFTVANPTYDNLLCDRYLAEGWYKFLNDGKLATTCQPFYQCNTHVPMWMQSSHPTIPGQTVDGVVCAPTTATGGCAVNDCLFKLQIRVKMCQNFYAYYLVPAPGCHMAYCAGDKTPCQVHQTSPTEFEPGCVDKYPMMLINPHLSNPILTPSVNPTSFKFQCEVNFDPARNEVGFDVTFLFDGQPDAKVRPVTISGASRTADLDQMQLMGHLGQTVSCKVRSYFLHPPPSINGTHYKSPYLASNGYWAGIRVDKDRLMVREKDPPQTLTMYSTVPIVCPPPHSATCQLDIELETRNNTNSITIADKCKVTFTPDMWNSITNRAETTFQVSATRDGKNDKDKEIYLHFNPVASVDASPIFVNYQVPLVQITDGNIKTGTCYCTADPHCKTFDAPDNGVNLDYYLVGEFIMFKSTSRNFEVQVRTWTCGGASCNCAVAMKERNEVFILDMCHTQYGTTSFPRLTVPCMGARSNGTVVTHDNAGNEYLFSFPSGTVVKVDTRPGVWLNVYITTPEDDMQATEGICGYFDGNPDNDLKHSDNTFSVMPKNGRIVDDDFVNSWRIKPAGSSIFDTKIFTVDPSLDHDMYYCKCDTNSNTTIADCTLHGNVAKPNVQALLPGGNQQNPTSTCKNPAAHTRTASTILPDDYPADYVFDYGLTYVPILRADFPSEHGKSRADAEAACNTAIDQNPIVQQCVLRAGLDFAPEKGNCVEDFKYFDNGEFVRSNMLSAITKCILYVLKNESFYDANGNLPAFISSDLCPAYDCNTHGTCSLGRCICDAGYVGDACKIQSSRPPVLNGVVKATWLEGSVLCDVTERMCETAFVHGNNVFDNPRLSCMVEVLNFDGNGFVPSGIQLTTAAVYKSMYQVGCKLPLKSTIGGQTVVAFNISVTNDARTYSNAVTYVRTDTRCARCIKMGKSCSVKVGTCLIEGNCWITGETDPSNGHQVCDPSTNNVQWTNAATEVLHTTSTIAEIGACAAKEADVVFVVDTSGSIGIDNFDKVKGFIKDIVRTFDVDPRYTQVALVEFSTNARIEFKLNEHSNLTDLIAAIDNIHYSGGGTMTSDALELMRGPGYEGERPGAPDISIVITDGLSKYPPITKIQADRAKAEGITMFSIGIGNQTDPTELTGLASGPQFQFQVGEFGALSKIDNVVAHLACGVILPTNPYIRVTTTMTPTPAGCVDLVDCSGYFKDSCSDYEPYARGHCANTCGFCGTEVERPCKDAITNCGSYGTYMCFDISQYQWVDKNCRKFCGFCGNKTEVLIESSTVTSAVITTQAQCVDERRCQEYNADLCTNPEYRGFAERNCRRYCGYCLADIHTVTPHTTGSLTCPAWVLPKECRLEREHNNCCPVPICTDGFKLLVKRA